MDKMKATGVTETKKPEPVKIEKQPDSGEKISEFTDDFE